jgi:transmembrane sensor
MSSSQENETDIALLAAQWVVRAQAEAFDDSHILELTQWLEADVAHARAFENALITWEEVDALRPAEAVPAPVSEPVTAPVAADVVSLSAFRARTKARKPSFWRSPGLLAAAAALTAAILLPMFALKGAPVQAYETRKGQRQTIALADGSSLQLNTDTRVTVQLSAHARKLVLDRGEVALKVTHDASRPLTLTAGEAQITDLGTEFNVRRDADGGVAVAVREGEVQFADAGAPATTLQRGDVARHAAGSAGAVVSHGDPDEAFAWQNAHAIYRDQPLAVVARDLNRYFDKPIVVDDQAGKLRLSAVLTLDSEPLVVRRLQDFLPVQAKATDSGIYLSADARGDSRH